MLAGEARAAARHWVPRHAGHLPGFRGAYLAGSAAERPADAPQPPWPDVDGGDHRKAVFWIVATAARCRQILAADAPPHRRRAGEHEFRETVGAPLGVHDPEDLRSRPAGTLALLPELDEATAEIGGFAR